MSARPTVAASLCAPSGLADDERASALRGAQALGATVAAAPSAAAPLVAVFSTVDSAFQWVSSHLGVGTEASWSGAVATHSRDARPLAAALASAAQSGHLLLEETAFRDLASHVRGLAERIRPLGPTRLFDIPEVPTVWAVRHADCGDQAPLHPNRVPRPGSTNLHDDLPRLIGRDAALDAVVNRVAVEGSRVVITGTPEAGRRLLAQYAGMRSLPRYHDAGGVWFVDAEDAPDAATVARAVARAMGMPKPADSLRVVNQLGRWLRDNPPCLVVVSNADVLGGHVAITLDAWRSIAPHASFLLTSEAPLDAEQEECIALPQLALEDAVQLLAERAGERLEARGRWHHESIVSLIRQVDRTPGALLRLGTQLDGIEPAALATKLTANAHLPGWTGEGDDELELLGDAVWERLSEAHRDVLRLATVFHGPIDPDVFEELQDAAYPNPPHTLLRELEALADMGCLYDDPKRAGRLRMYAHVQARARRAADADPPAALTRQWAARYLGELSRLADELDAQREPSTLSDARAMWPELVGALQWAREDADADLPTTITLASPLFLALEPGEAHLRLLDEALTEVQRTNAPITVRVHACRAEAFLHAGRAADAVLEAAVGTELVDAKTSDIDQVRIRRLLARALQLTGRIDDAHRELDHVAYDVEHLRLPVASARIALARVAGLQDALHVTAAQTALDEAKATIDTLADGGLTRAWQLQACRQYTLDGHPHQATVPLEELARAAALRCDTGALAEIRTVQASCALSRGACVQARRFAEEARAIHRQRGQLLELAADELALAKILRISGDKDAATRAVVRSYALLDGADIPSLLADIDTEIGVQSHIAGHLSHARDAYSRAIMRLVDADMPIRTARIHGLIAAVDADMGDLERASRTIRSAKRASLGAPMFVNAELDIRTVHLHRASKAVDGNAAHDTAIARKLQLVQNPREDGFRPLDVSHELRTAVALLKAERVDTLVSSGSGA